MVQVGEMCRSRQIRQLKCSNSSLEKNIVGPKQTDALQHVYTEDSHHVYGNFPLKEISMEWLEYSA